MTLLISTDDTAKLVQTREAIDVLDEAYRALANREATHRIRSDVVVPTVPGEEYTLATMEGAIRPLGVAAIRLRSDHSVATVRHQSPSSTKWAFRPGLFCGLVILYSLDTAEPLAIINDGHLQVMRVGATSAVAARYLARPDSRVLGIIGASNQARGHARAYSALFRLDLVKVFSRTAEERERFAEEMSEELGVPFEAVDNAREAVAGSHIVAACTSSRSPVLEENWIEDGTYTSSVRYFHEIGLDNVQRMDVHAVHNAGYGPLYKVGSPEEWAQSHSAYMDAKEPIPDGAVLLEEVVAGLKPGRTSPEQRTFFNNNAGKGIQFAALGKLVYDRARQRGLGRELPTEWFLQDIST